MPFSLLRRREEIARVVAVCENGTGMNEPRLHKPPRPDHHANPLRPIIRRDIQDGQAFVVLACNHVAAGVPASRASRFYPCPFCAETVPPVAVGGVTVGVEHGAVVLSALPPLEFSTGTTAPKRTGVKRL